MRTIRHPGVLLLGVLCGGVIVCAGAGVAAAAWSAPATLTPADGLGTCLREAGADRVALLGEIDAASAETDLVTLVPGAAPSLTPNVGAKLGWLIECADVATAAGSPDDLTLFAAPVHVPGKGAEIRVGGPGGVAPTTLRRVPRGRFATGVRVALAADGAAVVAWVERSRGFDRRRPNARLLAAHRPGAGAAFGPATEIHSALLYDTPDPPALGIDASGRATVAWQGGDTGAPWLSVIESDAGGRFGEPRHLGAVADAMPSSLAVAADGRALLTSGGWEEPTLYERPAAGARFAAVRGVEVQYANETAVALGPDGAALVVARVDPDYVVALHRAAGASRFAAPRRLAGRPVPGVSDVGFDTLTTVGGSPRPVDAAPLDDTLAAALDAQGRALVTWTRPATRWRAAAAMAAAGDARGRFAGATPLGSRCRAATAVRPLPLTARGLGAAWTDLGRSRDGDLETLIGYAAAPTAGGGRLNVVVPREAVAEPAVGGPTRAPHVSARVLGPRALRIGAPLRLRVRCPRDGSPCGVRAAATARMVERRDGRRRRFDGSELLSAATTLAPGAAAVLRLDPSPEMRIAPLGRGRARIALTACATAGQAATGRELRPRLRGLPRTPSPRLLGVRARRVGDAVRVTGRLSRSAPDTHIVMQGVPGRSYASVDLRGRVRFGATLRGQGAGRVRRVVLTLRTQERWEAGELTVRVGAAPARGDRR